MITCLKCRQPYSETDHRCLDELSVEELFSGTVEEELARLMAAQEAEWDDKIVEVTERRIGQGALIPDALRQAYLLAQKRIRLRAEP